MRYLNYLPEEHRGKSDSKLPQLVKQLKRVLTNVQRKFAHNTLKLDGERQEELAGILIDFAVDIHNDIGIWTAYERYNTELFGSPLPLTADVQTTGISRERLRHLLWMTYPQLVSDLVISPQHQDMLKVADAALELLNEKVLSLPKDSGIKQFMASSNELGWEVKRKLIWLGTRSYMFRLLYRAYMDKENEGKFDVEHTDDFIIEHTDDFICQETTCWSGLGTIDILAGVLDISDEQRRELRSWYLRHNAAFKLLSVHEDSVDALNVISDQPYHIRFSVERNPFRKGQLISGSVTPWRGEWYWSGSQRLFGEATLSLIDWFKKEMKPKTSIICRYWKEQEQLVQERFAVDVKRMLEYHGSDLIVYPDGLLLAADFEREMKAIWDSMPPEKVKAALEKLGMKEPHTDAQYPKDLIEHKDGLAVFINPDEGKEILVNYNTVTTGLKKNGEDLNENELETIQGVMNCDAISPAFVRRLLREHGGEESIKATFMLTKCSQSYWLEYLLRSLKGHFYRKRFPLLSVI
ncbi:MAG: DUF3843 family protein [Nitrospinae bacterium]|nr:DUF3843 family protein [Nitrospinota bacterium]